MIDKVEFVLEQIYSVDSAIAILKILGSSVPRILFITADEQRFRCTRVQWRHNRENTTPRFFGCERTQLPSCLRK